MHHGAGCLGYHLVDPLSDNTLLLKSKISDIRELQMC